MNKIDISNISGQSMRVFLAVYDEISVSKAALRLGQSQSSVSHTLEKMRGIIGAELFQKSGRGIVPTALATRVAPILRRIVADLESLGESEDYNPATDSSPVVIALNGSAMAVMSSRLRETLWEAVPYRELCLRELGSRDNLEDCLQRQEADLAIVPRLNTYPQTLQYSSLYKDRSVIYFDPTRRGPVTTIEDYGSARHAVLDFGGRTKSNVEQQLAQWAINREVCLRVHNVWLMAEALTGSDMIATLPETLIRGPLSHLQTCEPPFVKAPFTFDLTWHMRQENSARNLWLRRIVQRSVEGLLASAAP